MHVGLEQVLHQFGLKLWNLLKDFDALIEDVEDLLNDLLGLSRVSWNQLIWLEDEVEHKEWLWILVLVKLREEPDLSLLKLCEVGLGDVLVRQFLEVTVILSNHLLLEGVVHLIGVDDVGGLGTECQNELDELLH